MWSKQPRVICSSLLGSRVHFHQVWCFQTYPLKKKVITAQDAATFPSLCSSSGAFRCSAWVAILALHPHQHKQISLIPAKPQSSRGGSSPEDKKQPAAIFGHVFNNSVGHYLETKHWVDSAVRFLLQEPRGLFLSTRLNCGDPGWLLTWDKWL